MSLLLLRLDEGAESEIMKVTDLLLKREMLKNCLVRCKTSCSFCTVSKNHGKNLCYKDVSISS